MQISTYKMPGNKYQESAYRFEILEMVEGPNDLLAREQIYLDFFNASEYGYNILPTAGNMLGLKHSEEAKAKISKAQRGKVVSSETRARMGKAQKGKIVIVSNETRKRMSEAHIGVTKGACSEETKIKIARANKGKIHSENAKLVMSEKRKGSNNPRAKLTWELVAEIRGRLASGESQKVLAKEYGISTSPMNRIANNTAWIVDTEESA